MEIAFDERGLVPVVIQDWRTGEVLTLAYANAEALALTRETGELHLWSRSRGELWHKGATSGNIQRVRALRIDCDARRAAGARRAGRARLPHRRAHVLLQRATSSRRAARGAARRSSARSPNARPTRPEGSYTVELLDDPPLIGEKVREEAEEVARAAREETDERVDEEAADVLYHLTVLLHSRGRSLADAERGARLAAVAEHAARSSPDAASEVARARAATTTSSRCATRSSTTARRRSPRS